jgi:2,3-bisphosphoglycerate-dependent phosphoglycerate mutase
MPPDRPVVLLARHGETEWNRDARIQGSRDVPLSGVGHAQAAALAERLRRSPCARIVSSDLLRARATADAVAAALGLPVVLDAHLREQNLGAWEGGTFADAALRDPDLARRFRERDPDARPPGGETRRELQSRVVAALESHAAPGTSGPVLLVTHGGPLQTLVYHLLGLPLTAPRRFLVPNAGLTTLSFRNGSWFISSLCDVSHLPSSPGESFPFE